MFSDADVIFSYFRKQAIDDGVLFDVTAAASKAGFNYPTAITAAVRSECTAAAGHSQEQYLLEVLLQTAVNAAQREQARRQAENLGPTDRWSFRVEVNRSPQALWAVVGPGDTEAPVVTVMMEGED